MLHRPVIVDIDRGGFPGWCPLLPLPRRHGTGPDGARGPPDKYPPGPLEAHIPQRPGVCRALLPAFGTRLTPTRAGFTLFHNVGTQGAGDRNDSGLKPGTGRL
jgi:hypothetical protein